jgi:Sec-independent protein translocase protein TatA
VLDISPEKLLVVVAIALAVLGPEGIPRVARGLAKARAEIRRLTADVPPDALHAISNPRGALLDAVSGPRQAVAEAVSRPRLALGDAIAGFKLSDAPAAVDPPPSVRGSQGPPVGVAPDEPGFN